MDKIWFLAALWVGLALVATLLAIWFGVSTALSEIVVGTVAQLIIGVAIGGAGLGSQTPWVTFLAGTGAIVLTFPAGAELDPTVFRVKWKEATVVGLAGFFAPFLGSAAIAHYVLGWDPRPAWLAGVALSTTSVAVVYAVMFELGFNVEARDQALLAGVETQTAVRQGHEVETIVTHAREGRFDLLLAGYHGHSRIFERVMGSTAQSIIRLSPRSVLLAWSVRLRQRGARGWPAVSSRAAQPLSRPQSVGPHSPRR